MYLPWVVLAVNLILSSGGFDSLLGILIGHLYFFLKFQYPQELGGHTFLETPEILFRRCARWIPGQSTSNRTESPSSWQSIIWQRWGTGNTMGRN